MKMSKNCLIPQLRLTKNGVFGGLTTGFALSVLCLGLLLGCSAMPTVEPLSYIVSGKAVIRTAAADQNMRFRWQQQSGYFDIWLWGTLGAGRTHLQGTQKALTISLPKQPVKQGPAKQIMQEQLGWSLPLAALGAWLRGRVAPQLAVDAEDIDAQGRLLAAEQAGWSVTFSQHQPDGKGWRPRQISVSGRDLTLQLTLTVPRAVMLQKTSQSAKKFDTAGQHQENSALENRRPELFNGLTGRPQ